VSGTIRPSFRRGLNRSVPGSPRRISTGIAAWRCGREANAALAAELSRRMDARVAADNFAVRFEAGTVSDAVGRLVEELRGADPRQIVPTVNEDALEGLKFAACLPPAIATEVVRGRLADDQAVGDVLGRTTRVVSET
jgi:ATP-dependent helicase Lhr and Lhr-like helicase